MTRPTTAAGCLTILALALPAVAVPPATKPATKPAAKPADSPVDDILGLAKPATSQPAATTAPAAPLADAAKADAGRDGTLTLSDGTTVTGKVATTAEKPVRVWVEADKEYTDVPLSMVKTIEASVTWERDEPEWNFKESGSDVKVYSGKTYPARETTHTLTLADGTAVSGPVLAPLYVTTADGKQATYVLHKRDKGAVGTTLAKLVYVKKVEFK